MVWTVRNTVSASVGIIVVMTALWISPASADDPCDLVLSDVIDGTHTVGDLELIVTDAPVGWNYTVSTPLHYDLVWLDGAHAVVDGMDGISIGGGILTRSASIGGNFVQISACFVERSRASFRPEPL